MHGRRRNSGLGHMQMRAGRTAHNVGNSFAQTGNDVLSKGCRPYNGAQMTWRGVIVATSKMGSRIVTMIVAIALMVGIFFANRLIAPRIVALTNLDIRMVTVVVRSVLSVAAFIALGGKCWLRFDLRAVANAWRFIGYLIVVIILMGAINALGTLSAITNEQIETLSSTTVSDNFIFITILCILVGINEEVLFRGLLCGGLLAVFGGKKGGVIFSAVVSSFVFGYFHVMDDIDFTNVLEIAQGLTKTLQTGMFGFILCAPMLEDHNMGGAISFHGFNDWVVMIGMALTGLPTDLGTYVSKNAQTSIAAIAVLGVFCLIYLPKCIKAYRLMANLAMPQYGPFVRQDESQPSQKKGKHAA